MASSTFELPARGSFPTVELAKKAPKQADALLIATFAGYLVLMIGIGLWAWRRTRTFDDYILGGRSLGSVVTARRMRLSPLWVRPARPGKS